MGLLGGLATFAWSRAKYGIGGNALCWVFNVIERGCVLYQFAVNSLHVLDEEPNLQMRYIDSC